jgi:hypothetical protein
MRSGKGYSWIVFFFLDNHPEYFEKVIKSIAKAKYRNIKKKRIHLEKQKEKKKTNLLQ